LAGSAFKSADVVKLFTNWTPVLVDGDTEKAATKRYAVGGYPTIVFADAAGGEVDRISGWMKTDAYAAEVGRILSGEGTLPVLRKRVDEAPDDVDAAVALGAKYARSDAKEAARVFSGLVEKTKDKDRATQAKVRLEYAAALFGSGDAAGAMTQAEALVREFADTPSAAAVASRAGEAFLSADTARALAFLDAARPLAKEPAEKAAVERLAVTAHKNAIVAAFRRQAAAAGDDPAALNEIAWTCFEMKVNIREALDWARTAVDKSDRDPAILDTLANLLWLTGKRDEALKTEEEALANCADDGMTREFRGLLAKWKTELGEAAKPAPVPVPAQPADGAK
jgi:tetratricopeptide (TPR) repeat protein